MKSDDLVNTLQEALENGADPNVQNENGDTFLHRIPEEMPDLWKDGAEFIELALKKGANVNIQNKEGKTPLMLFAATHYDKYIPLLLDAGADVNIQDNDGNTAVHLSHFNCLLPILKAKPDLMLANKKGVTAINRLRNEGYYYTDGFVYESKQSVKEAIDALGLDIPTDQQLQGVQWTPKAIDLSKNLPEQLSEASSYYFPYNDCSDELMYLGKNLLALVGGYPRVIHIFDVEKGKVVWCLNSAARMGYAIYDESRNVVYVARDGSSTANYITAHDPDTGKELWKKPCKLTNSSEQFGTVFVQNSTHIIHANIRKDVLYFVNKDTAKLDAKLNMENGVACSAYFTEDNTMCVYKNNLYVAGVNRKQDGFTVDKYDISTQTFTGTIFTSNLGERMSDFIAVDNILYLFDDRGILYKMDLTDGKIIAKVAHGTEGQKTPDDIRIRKLKRAGDKLVYTLRNYTKDEDINREYDLATDKISPYTPVKINEKGLKYGKEKWLTIKQLILGDSIFEVQKEAWSSSSKSCFLHRLN